jgi:hypothetical protein
MEVAVLVLAPIFVICGIAGFWMLCTRGGSR